MFWSMCVFIFVCVSMQMKQKESQHLSGCLGGMTVGGVFTQTNTPFVVFPGLLYVACWRQGPFGAFGVRAKCVSGLCSKVIW